MPVVIFETPKEKPEEKKSSVVEKVVAPEIVEPETDKGLAGEPDSLKIIRLAAEGERGIQTENEIATETTTRGTLRTVLSLILNGLSFGLYEPKFTEEEKKKHPVIFGKIPLREAVLDKIPVVNWVSEAFLPYDVSLASALSLFPLGLAVKGFGRLGTGVLKLLRLEEPVLKTTTGISEKIIRRVKNKEFYELMRTGGEAAETEIQKQVGKLSRKWGERLAGEVALGWGVGVGSAIKEMAETKDVGRGLTTFAVSSLLNTVLFPIFSVGGELGLRGAGRVFGKILGKKVADTEIAAAKKKITESGLRVLNEVADRSEKEVIDNLYKLSEKDFLANVVSPEIVKKIGLDQLTFSSIKRVDDINNAGLRLLVQRYLTEGVFPAGMSPEAKEKVARIAESIKSNYQAGIEREVAVVDDILQRLKASKILNKNFIPEELRRKNVNELTNEEKEIVLGLVNNALKSRQIEIKEPEVVKFFAENPSLLERTKDALLNSVSSVLTEASNKWSSTEKADFVKAVLPQIQDIKLSLYNEWLRTNRNSLPTNLAKNLDVAEQKVRETFEKEVAEKLFDESLNYFTKQYQAIFETADKGEGIINFLKALNSSSQPKRVVETLNSSFVAATKTETNNFLLKYNRLLKSPIEEIKEKIAKGSIKNEQLPPSLTTGDLLENIKKIEAEMLNSKKDPASFIGSKRALDIPDYDIWDLAADTYQIMGLNREEVANAFLLSKKENKLNSDIFKNVFDYYVKTFAPAKEIRKKTKDPVARMALLLEEIKKEETAFRSTKTNPVIFANDSAIEKAEAIRAVEETVETKIRENAIKEVLPSSIVEKTPPIFTNSFAKSVDGKDFVERIEKLWENGTIFDYFVIGGKYGLKKEPKIGDEFLIKMPHLYSENLKVRVGKIIDEIDGKKYLLESSRKKGERYILRGEEIGFYRYLASLGDANEPVSNIGEFLLKIFKKNLIKK
jgi:hypothetical protein